METRDNDAAGFWIVVGRAVENQGNLEDYKRQPKESDEDYRRRLESKGDIKLNTKDLDALIMQHDGKTIIDLIEECRQNWPFPPPLRASYRT